MSKILVIVYIKEKIMAQIDDLTKHLAVKKNEAAMLFKTFEEIVSKGQDDALEAMSDAIITTLTDITSVEREIHDLRMREVEDYCSNPYYMRRDYTCLDPHLFKDEGECATASTEVLDTSGEKIYSDIYKNNFMVSFSNGFYIPNEMIKSVLYWDFNEVGDDTDYVNSIEFTIEDYVLRRNRQHQPLVKLLEESKDKTFECHIAMTNKDGIPIYTEHYKDCKIVGVYKDPLGHRWNNNGKNEKSTVSLKIKYQSMTVDTPYDYMDNDNEYQVGER